jgi:IS4 transposase
MDARRVEVDDPDKDGTLVFLTNHLEFGATTIAAIYKDRWQVELFFKAHHRAFSNDAAGRAL